MGKEEEEEKYTKLNLGNNGFGMKEFQKYTHPLNDIQLDLLQDKMDPSVLF